ncbi:MAG: hypothetical protein JST80_12580 [Bdellovibrionales bacterium]|nr:hypothetical protein [Bdellovibrionales bacterium]
MSAKNIFVLGLSSAALFALTACNLPFVKKEDEVAVTTAANYLYIASGACYAGGIATAPATNVIVKYDLNSGARVGTMVDYRTQAPGDSPVGITSKDADTILVAVENSNGGRHLDQVRRDGSNGWPYLLNTTILAASLRDVVQLSDGGHLITRTTLAEKISAFRTRIPAASAFISAPAAPCATSTTSLTFGKELSNGKILLGHAATAPNNKIIAISATGYAGASDCVSARAAPTTTAKPVAAASVSADKFIVAYAGALAGDNLVVSYQYNTGTTAIDSATATNVMTNNAYMFGASAMAYDAANSDVYIASSPAFAEKIEKFHWNDTAQTLTRVGDAPYIHAPDLACISGMYVGP